MDASLHPASRDRAERGPGKERMPKARHRAWQDVMQNAIRAQAMHSWSRHEYTVLGGLGGVRRPLYLVRPGWLSRTTGCARLPVGVWALVAEGARQNTQQ